MSLVIRLFLENDKVLCKITSIKNIYNHIIHGMKIRIFKSTDR